MKDISSANEKPRFSEVIRPSRDFYESRGATGEDERKLIDNAVSFKKPHPPPHLVLSRLVVFHSSLFTGLAHSMCGLAIYVSLLAFTNHLTRCSCVTHGIQLTMGRTPMNSALTFIDFLLGTTPTPEPHQWKLEFDSFSLWLAC